MNELTVQIVYDTLQERIILINQILSAYDNKSSKFSRSDKLREKLEDISLDLCKYVQYIENNESFSDKEKPANKILSGLYYNVLCPDKKE